MAGSREAADTSPLPLTDAPNLTPKISELTRPMSSPRRPEHLDDFDHSDDTASQRPDWINAPDARYGSSVLRDTDDAVSVRPEWVHDMLPLESAVKFDAIRRSDHPTWQDNRSERRGSLDDTDSVAGESVRPTWIGDTDSVITDQGRRRWTYDVESDAGESVQHGWVDRVESETAESERPKWIGHAESSIMRAHWMNPTYSTTAQSEVGSVRPEWMTDNDDAKSQRPGWIANEATPSVISQRPSWIAKADSALASLVEERSYHAQGGPTGTRPRTAGMAVFSSVGAGVEVDVSDKRLPGQTNRRRSRPPGREDEHPQNVTWVDDGGKLSEALDDRGYRLATEVIT